MCYMYTIYVQLLYSCMYVLYYLLYMYSSIVVLHVYYIVLYTHTCILYFKEVSVVWVSDGVGMGWNQICVCVSSAPDGGLLRMSLLTSRQARSTAVLIGKTLISLANEHGETVFFKVI